MRGLRKSRLPARRANANLARIGVLHIHLRRSGLSKVAGHQTVHAGSPSGRPIPLVIEGESLTLFRQAGADPAWEPRNAEAMAGRVVRFMKLSSAEREETRRHGQSLSRDVLSFANGADRTERILLELAKERQES